MDKNNIFNSKYSKILTVVLIVVIIAVVILLGFLGYDVYTKYSIEAETGDAVSEFKDQLNKIEQNEINELNETLEQNIVENAIVPDINLNEVVSTDPTPKPTGGNSNHGGNGVTVGGHTVIGIIEIPATNIEYPIIAESDASPAALKVGICNIYGKLNTPGENAILVGHNFRNGTFFSNNKKLKKGDKIYITDNSGKKVTYIISKKYETSTGDSAYITRDVGNKRAISLSTCTDDTKKRLIIWAEEQ